MNIPAHTLHLIRTELLSLRHPSNDDPKFTRCLLFGIGLALLSLQLISAEQHDRLCQLIKNANTYHTNKTPWPAGPWLPF